MGASPSVGATRESRWREIVRGSFVARLSRLAEGIDDGLEARLEESQVLRLVSEAQTDHLFAIRTRRDGRHVGTGAVPAQECVDGEGEAEVVYAWSPASSRPNARCPNHLS